MTNGARALDIANYVVSFALKNKKLMTHLHLQKILYFLEVVHLYTCGKSLFPENIEKWRLGPVVPEVYHEYKIFGNDPISFIPTEREILLGENGDFFLKEKKFDENEIDAELRQFLDSKIEKLLEIDDYELMIKTRQHDIWKRDEARINSGIKGIKYDKKEMEEYFKANPQYLSDLGLL